jgi:hypothetical protein
MAALSVVTRIGDREGGTRAGNLVAVPYQDTVVVSSRVLPSDPGEGISILYLFCEIHRLKGGVIMVLKDDIYI